MRLSTNEIHAIKTVSEKLLLGLNCSVNLYGSRCDTSKNGGDIDLAIVYDGKEPDNTLELLLNFETQLTKIIGDQKIDISLFAKADDSAFYKLIQSQFKQLWSNNG